ncbi:hypothetical protein Tco_1574989, partial [Tanacetum coccineum]
ASYENSLPSQILEAGQKKLVNDGDRGRVRFQDGRISSGIKKSRGSNIGDSQVASATRRSLDKLSEESREVFPGEAGK